MSFLWQRLTSEAATLRMSKEVHSLQSRRAGGYVEVPWQPPNRQSHYIDHLSIETYGFPDPPV
jgi:hypothetical protein